MAFPYVSTSDDEKLEESLLSGFTENCKSGFGRNRITYTDTCAVSGQDLKTYHNMDAINVSRYAFSSSASVLYLLPVPSSRIFAGLGSVRKNQPEWTDWCNRLLQRRVREVRHHGIGRLGETLLVLFFRFHSILLLRSSICAMAPQGSCFPSLSTCWSCLGLDTRFSTLPSHPVIYWRTLPARQWLGTLRRGLTVQKLAYWANVTESA